MKQSRPRIKPAHGGLVFLSLAGAPLFASAAERDDVTQLETIRIKGEKTAELPDVTGLGTLHKSSEDLAQQQVMGIRDLIRHDPGIAVNESGGRGTSSGYAIRGVDKERVALQVDGMQQGQSLLRQHGFGGGRGQGDSSGAKNEVEFENLKSVDISQGANSTIAGSGALGGVVTMQTKDAEDFFFGDKDWGVLSKASLSSKDGRRARTFGVGGRNDIGLEGMVQYTGRHGHEIRAHRDIYGTTDEIKHYATDGTRMMTSELPATAMSGPGRRVPNPLQYESDSWLAKLGYHLSDGKYLGLIHEDTHQRYKMRDMFARNYWSNEREDSIFAPGGNMADFLYTPSRYFIDRHRYTRFGIEYKYRATDDANWLDSIHVRADRQNIAMNSRILSLNCSPFPSVDPACRAAAGQPGTRSYAYDTRYAQRLGRFEFSAEKTLELAQRHTLRLNSGVEKQTHTVTDQRDLRYAYTEFNSAIGRIAQHFDEDKAYHSTGPLRGTHHFIALSDVIAIGDAWTLGVGGRYDQHRFRATSDVFDVAQAPSDAPSSFPNSRYRNTSWHLGLTYSVHPAIDLAYKASNGFRVPTTAEQLGPSYNHRESRISQPLLKAEKAINHEAGLHLHTRWVMASASYFLADYKNLIDIGMPLPGLGYPDGYAMYYNLQSVKTKGLNLKADLDMHAAWPRLPDGLRAVLSLSHVSARGQPPALKDFVLGGSYALDMLQPMRAVYGIAYTHPDDRWSLALTSTFSAAKKDSELMRKTVLGGLSYENDRSNDIRTPRWIITDLTGHVRVNKHVTVRAGVYNMFNYRYISWESARQASFDRIGNTVVGNDYAALAAPGRHYVASLELRY